MNKQKFFFALLFLIIGVLGILFFVDKEKINEQKNRVSDLDDKINSLEKNISDLKDEKEELQNKIEYLTKKQIQSFQQKTTIPNFQETELTPDNNIGQIAPSNGTAIVVYKSSSCDYFILENATGYIVAEWMGQNDPDKGDKITGDFSSFGTKDFYNQTKETGSNLWIDDFMLSKEDAFDNIRENCR